MCSSLRVLLVEDEPLILEVMAESLREAGYEVVEAADGVEAVILLANPPKPFTVLVTDFHMPGGVDGAEVASHARKTNPGLPVVIATGRPDVLQRSWRDDLKYVLLRKPYRPSDLVKLVRHLVRTTGLD